MALRGHCWQVVALLGQQVVDALLGRAGCSRLAGVGIL